MTRVAYSTRARIASLAGARVHEWGEAREGTSERPGVRYRAPMVETPEPLLGTFAVLQALTGFVPVPFLDGILARQIARRMVETVAGTHGLRLPDEEIKLFASEPDEGFFAFLKSTAKGLLLIPFRLLFKAIFLVLDAKQVTELVGKAYARSVCLDIVFGEGWYLKHGAAKVAPAVEVALAAVDTRPLKLSLIHISEPTRPY